MVSERMLYWYKYYEWIKSVIASSDGIDRRCAELVFKKTNNYERSDKLSEEEIDIVFGL